MSNAYAVGALRLVPRWIAADKDLAPIHAGSGFIFEGSREDAERAARARVAETDPATPARKFHCLMPADRYRVVWAARHGEAPSWRIFPKDA